MSSSRTSSTATHSANSTTSSGKRHRIRLSAVEAVPPARQLHDAVCRAVVTIADDAQCDAVTQSALEIMADVLERYIIEICSQAHLYAFGAGRVDLNMHDVKAALDDMNVDLTDLLRHWKATSEKNMQLYPNAAAVTWEPRPARAQALGGGVNVGEVDTSLGSENKIVRHKAIPSFCPPFPESHSFKDTPVFDTVETEYSEVEKKRRAMRDEGSIGLASFVARAAQTGQKAVVPAKSIDTTKALVEVVAADVIGVSPIIPVVGADRDEDAENLAKAVATVKKAQRRAAKNDPFLKQPTRIDTKKRSLDIHS